MYDTYHYDYHLPQKLEKNEFNSESFCSTPNETPARCVFKPGPVGTLPTTVPYVGSTRRQVSRESLIRGFQKLIDFQLIVIVLAKPNARN